MIETAIFTLVAIQLPANTVIFRTFNAINMAKKSRQKPDKDKAPVHENLKNMDIRVNEMGEIIKDYDIDDINEFLDKNVKDKKLNNEQE